MFYIRATAPKTTAPSKPQPAVRMAALLVGDADVPVAEPVAVLLPEPDEEDEPEPEPP